MASPETRSHAGVVPRRGFSVVDRLAAVLSTQHELGSRDLDLAGLRACVVEQSVHLTGASGAFLIGVDRSEVVVFVARGLAASLEGSRELVAESLALRAVAGGQVYRSDETVRDPLLDGGWFGRMGARSALLVPVQEGRETVGVLSVVAADTHAFDDLDALTLGFMADIIVQGTQRWSQYKARHALMNERAAALRGRKVTQARADVLFAESPVPMAVLGEDLELTAVNDAFCRALGTHRDALLFRHLPSLLHGEDGRPPAMAADTFTARVKRQDQTFLSTRIRLTHLPSFQGRSFEMLAIFEDLQTAASQSAVPAPPAPHTAARTLAHGTVDIAVLLSNAFRSLHAGIQRNGLRVESRIAPRLFVAADPELIRYAVETLVASLVRSAPARATLVVQADVVKGAVVVQFSGSGLMDARIRNLFQPATPLMLGRDGLGLDEAHRIIGLHGGRLWWKPGGGQGAVVGMALAATA